MFARVANWVAIAAAAIVLLLLALLNVVLMFAVWAISSWTLAVGIWRRKRRALFRVGLLFLFLAGLSEVLASAFDVNQPLRGLADVLSLGLPIAAMFMADGPRTRGCHRVHGASEQARMDKRRPFSGNFSMQPTRKSPGSKRLFLSKDCDKLLTGLPELYCPRVQPPFRGQFFLKEGYARGKKSGPGCGDPGAVVGADLLPVSSRNNQTSPAFE